ncbi:MAG: hypothetical protein GY796_35795 [Chloroflexi bacterium]|nr:hypothetical protein [Chloroflexota bacterium]
MQTIYDELRSLIRDLGKDGGQISPSVYDTAQVLRFAPPHEGVDAAFQWLLCQQKADGGWGDPHIPMARDVPTLAAILVMHHFQAHDLFFAKATEAGLSFLRQQAKQWQPPLSNDIPIGIELILPRLLQDARDVNLDVPHECYFALKELGERRKKLIAKTNPLAGTTPAHSWEAWGYSANQSMLDETGGVGHSPAATANWIYLSKDDITLAEEREKAMSYLAAAAKATGFGIPGVVPTVWPIPGVEQAFGLYSLLITGLLDHPAVRDVVQAQLSVLTQEVGANGFGISKHFSPDGDDTAVALAVLSAANRPVNIRPLARFQAEHYFYTYPNELQYSLTATAHGIFALNQFGHCSESQQQFLMEQQQPDGRWAGEKWHASWLYPTLEIILALLSTANKAVLRHTAAGLLAQQRSDGGWGLNGKSTPTQTGYALIALNALRRHGLVNGTTVNKMTMGHQWLLNNQHTTQADDEKYWIGKETYREKRIDRIIELVAILSG